MYNLFLPTHTHTLSGDQSDGWEYMISGCKKSNLCNRDDQEYTGVLLIIQNKAGQPHFSGIKRWSGMGNLASANRVFFSIELSD